MMLMMMIATDPEGVKNLAQFEGNFLLGRSHAALVVNHGRAPLRQRIEVVLHGVHALKRAKRCTHAQLEGRWSAKRVRRQGNGQRRTWAWSSGLSRPTSCAWL